MTPSQCVAWNCPTRRRGDDTDDQTISFHSFPLTRPEMTAKWLASMGEPLWKPSRSSVLCSKHFEKSCFLQSYATPRLKASAVPTIFEKRPNPHVLVDLDKRTANEILLNVSVTPQGQLATLVNTSTPEGMVGSDGKRGRRRKVLRRYDPEEELATLRQMLEDERLKRRDLEQDIFKLRQEKSEMTAKMNRLEQSRCRPNIPQSLIPILVDAMAKGVDPLKKPEPALRGVRKSGGGSVPTKKPFTPPSRPAPPAKKATPIAKAPAAKSPAKPASATIAVAPAPAAASSAAAAPTAVAPAPAAAAATTETEAAPAEAPVETAATAPPADVPMAVDARP